MERSSWIAVLVWATMSFLGAWLAAQKRRSQVEGLILGLLFGPLGVIVEGLLPGGESEAPPPLPDRPAMDDRDAIRRAVDRQRKTP